MLMVWMPPKILMMASVQAATKVDMTSNKKRLLISDEVASLPPKKADMTSNEGIAVISSQASLRLLSNIVEKLLCKV